MTSHCIFKHPNVLCGGKPTHPHKVTHCKVVIHDSVMSTRSVALLYFLNIHYATIIFIYTSVKTVYIIMYYSVCMYYKQPCILCTHNADR